MSTGQTLRRVTGRGRLSPTWILALCLFAVGADFSIVLGITPAIADDLGEPIQGVILLASAYALPTILLAPVLGPLSDRRGRHVALRIGLIVFSLSAAACIVAPDLRLLLVARAVNGVGAAIVLPTAFAYANDIPDRALRDRTLGTVASAFPFAALVGIPIGALIASLVGWRGVFVFITVIGVAAFVALRALPVDRPGRSRPSGFIASYRGIVTDAGAMRLVFVTFVWRLAPSISFVLFAEYIHVTHGIAPEQAGGFLVVVGAVGVVAARLSGRLMRTIGLRRTVLISTTAGIIAAGLLPLSSASIVASVLLIALFAAGTWFGVPAIQAIVGSHSESLRGTLLAFNSSAVSLATFLGPIVAAVVFAAGGFSATFWLAMVIAMGAFGLILAILPRSTTSPTASAVAD